MSAFVSSPGNYGNGSMGKKMGTRTSTTQPRLALPLHDLHHAFDW